MSRKREQKHMRRRSAAAVTVVVLILAALALLALWLTRSGKVNTVTERTDSYNFVSGTDNVTCAVGSGLAVVSTSGLQVYDSTGAQTVGETFVAQEPMLTSCGEYGLCYDIGGTQLRLFTESGMADSVKTDGGILSAGVNSKGWSAVCAEESGYKGAVTVYQKDGTVAYKWLSGTAWLLAARVAEDNRQAAVLTLTDSGSRVVFLQMNQDTEVGETVLDGVLLVDIGYDADGTLYGISSDALYVLTAESEPELICDFADSTLVGYSFEGGPVLALNAYRTGGSCQIFTVTQDGQVLLASFEDGFLSLDTDDSNIAVLTDSKLTIYNRESGLAAAEYENTALGLSVGLTEDGHAIAASRNTAEVYAVTAEE